MRARAPVSGAHLPGGSSWKKLTSSQMDSVLYAFNLEYNNTPAYCLVMNAGWRFYTAVFSIIPIVEPCADSGLSVCCTSAHFFAFTLQLTVEDRAAVYSVMLQCVGIWFQVTLVSFVSLYKLHSTSRASPLKMCFYKMTTLLSFAQKMHFMVQ